MREEYDGSTTLKEKENSENWLEKLDKNSFPVTVHLPGIESQETVPRPEGPSYRNTPFKVAPLEMTINVHCSSPSAVGIFKFRLDLFSNELEVLHELKIKNIKL